MRNYLSEIRLRTMRSIFNGLKELSFVVGLWYLIFCVWQMNQPIFDSKIERIVIVSDNGMVVDQTNNRQRLVKPGETIEVFFHVDRYVDGTSIVERYVETPKKERIAIDTTVRTLVRGSSSVIINYKMPNFLPDGCGYSVFSRNNVTLDYNVLSQMTSRVVDSPKVEFCVKQ